MKTGNSSDTPSQRQPPDPHQTLNEFFERYALWECQAEVWKLLSAALSSEDADFWDKHDRGNSVFFCKNIYDVLQALYLIQEEFKKDHKQ